MGTSSFVKPTVTQALVLCPHLRSQDTSSLLHRTPEESLEEAISLAKAISNLKVVHGQIIPIRQPKAGTLFGKGTLKNLEEIIDETGASLVVIDTALTPIQQRNLERSWSCKVIDRTGLILEIFGERAQTKEGTLQVELAALTYQRSRLVKSWTHLERQRGGFGFLGGPGESQLEIDRRIIDERIGVLKKKLETVKRTRTLHRKNRREVPYPIVALVGYTNSGKSTLFNRLTEAHVMAEDLLFATLDPTMRQVKLPSGRKVILSDTVGFISNLPTSLVAAFRATLEEVQEADLLIHVRDLSHPQNNIQAEDVKKILLELGVEEKLEKHTLEAFNKIDLVDYQPTSSPDESYKSENLAFISALNGEGIPEFLTLIETHLAKQIQEHTLTLKPTEGKALAWLYEHGEVLERIDKEEALYLKIRLSSKNINRYEFLFNKSDCF